MNSRRIGNRVSSTALLLAGIVCFGSACRVDRRVAVIAHPPELPTQWHGIVSGFLIEWRCAHGLRESIETPPETSVRVALPVGTPSAVIFRPVLATRAEAFEPFPAGALFPSGEHNVVIGEWVDGAAAVVIDRFAAHGVVRYLNAARLFGEIRERAGDDPWALDLELIVDRLAAGGFRVTDLRTAATRTVFTTLPAGTWVSPNPFEPPVRFGPAGGIVPRDLPYGAHPLLNVPSHDVLTTYVTHDGTFFHGGASTNRGASTSDGVIRP